VSSFWAAISSFIFTTIGIVVSLAVLGTILFAVLDPRTRALFGYMYKGAMRTITGLS